MSFSDEDLKRLKDRFVDDPRSYRAKTMVVSLKGIQALLARLKAAEKVCSAAKVLLGPPKDLNSIVNLIDSLKAWGKVAGR